MGVLHTDAHANVRTDYDGQENYIRGELVKIVLNMFNKFDTSNDNYIFMDEFFLFGDALFTAELFFRRATRDSDKNAEFDEIDQNEWNCKPDADGYWDGTDGARCELSHYDLTHIEEMTGVAGDKSMDLDEFSDWFNGALKDAHKSSNWDGYCKNFVMFVCFVRLLLFVVVVVVVVVVGGGDDG